MKVRTLTLISLMTLSIVAISAPLSAQEQPSHLYLSHAGKGVHPHSAPPVADAGASTTAAFIADSAPSSKIITFNVPQAGKGFFQGTYPLDENSNGAITGYYEDTKNVNHGFLRTPDGTIITFDAPGAGKVPNQAPFPQGTSPQGINVNMAITGFYADANNLSHGFLRAANGAFTTFDVPGALNTYAENINAAGTISGYYEDAEINHEHGFVRAANGAITTFDAPGALNTIVIFTGMTANGAITGNCDDQDGNLHGFLRSPNGNITVFDVYGSLLTAGEGTTTTTDQTLAGFYADQNFVFHGLLRSPAGAIKEFSDPQAGLYENQGTEAFSVNPSHTSTGIYIDSNNVVHGFVRSSTGDFMTIDGPGAIETDPEVINTQGVITGYYFDRNEAAHGFVYTP